MNSYLASVLSQVGFEIKDHTHPTTFGQPEFTPGRRVEISTTTITER